jgi:hypothetical protein
MKAFLGLLFFLAVSDIALSQTAEVTLTPMTLSAEAPAEISALADCIDQTVNDVTPTAIVAAYPVILLVLRFLSEALGRAAAAGSASASTGVIVIRWLMAQLGWLFGKGGLGVPTAVMSKKRAKFKEMKAASTLATKMS